MSGMFDIQSVYPELMSPEEKLEKQTGIQTARAASGLAGLAGSAMARFNQKTTDAAFNMTGNRGLLSGEQNMIREFNSVDPNDPNAGTVMLDAARKYAPEKVPAVLSAMEAQRKSILEETLATNRDRREEAANTRAGAKLDMDQEQWTVFQEQQVFDNAQTTARFELAQRQFGVETSRLELSKRNMKLAEQGNARESMKHSVAMADRNEDMTVREALVSQLKAKGYDSLAEAVMSPKASIQSILQIEAANDKDKIMESISHLKLEVGTPPTESEVESYLSAAMNDLKTDIGEKWGDGLAHEENATEVEYLLRIWYSGGGYQASRVDPTASREEAMKFVRDNAAFQNPDLDNRDVVEPPIGNGLNNTDTAPNGLNNPTPAAAGVGLDHPDYWNVED